MRLNHACHICSTLIKTKFGLCPHCGPKLFALREPSVRADRGLSMHSLFAWRRDGWPALRSLAARLKGQEDPEPWLEVAAWFIQSKELEDRLPILVPVPSSGPNHALGWARALSHWTNWPVVEMLSKTDPNRQNKRLSRGERQQLQFHAIRVDLCTKYTEVIIVDDIVTTGATARAAYRALGRPRNCEVWCLLDRRPWQ